MEEDDIDALSKAVGLHLLKSGNLNEDISNSVAAIRQNTPSFQSEAPAAHSSQSSYPEMQSYVPRDPYLYGDHRLPERWSQDPYRSRGEARIGSPERYFSHRALNREAVEPDVRRVYSSSRSASPPCDQMYRPPPQVAQHFHRQVERYEMPLTARPRYTYGSRSPPYVAPPPPSSYPSYIRPDDRSRLPPSHPYVPDHRDTAPHLYDQDDRYRRPQRSRSPEHREPPRNITPRLKRIGRRAIRSRVNRSADISFDAMLQKHRRSQHPSPPFKKSQEVRDVVKQDPVVTLPQHSGTRDKIAIAIKKANLRKESEAKVLSSEATPSHTSRQGRRNSPRVVTKTSPNESKMKLLGIPITEIKKHLATVTANSKRRILSPEKDKTEQNLEKSSRLQKPSTKHSSTEKLQQKIKDSSRKSQKLPESRSEKNLRKSNEKTARRSYSPDRHAEHKPNEKKSNSEKTVNNEQDTLSDTETEEQSHPEKPRLKSILKNSKVFETETKRDSSDTHSKKSKLNKVPGSLRQVIDAVITEIEETELSAATDQVSAEKEKVTALSTEEILEETIESSPPSEEQQPPDLVDESFSSKEDTTLEQEASIDEAQEIDEEFDCEIIEEEFLVEEEEFNVSGEDDEELLNLRLLALSSAYHRNVDIVNEDKEASAKEKEEKKKEYREKKEKLKEKIKKKKAKQKKKQEKFRSKSSEKRAKKRSSKERSPPSPVRVQSTVSVVKKKLVLSPLPKPDLSDPKILTLGGILQKRKSLANKEMLREIRKMNDPDEGSKQFIKLMQKSSTKTKGTKKQASENFEAEGISNESKLDQSCDNYEIVEMEVEDLEECDVNDKKVAVTEKKEDTLYPPGTEDVGETPNTSLLDHTPSQESIWELLDNPLRKRIPDSNENVLNPLLKQVGSKHQDRPSQSSEESVPSPATSGDSVCEYQHAFEPPKIAYSMDAILVGVHSVCEDFSESSGSSCAGKENEKPVAKLDAESVKPKSVASNKRRSTEDADEMREKLLLEILTKRAKSRKAASAVPANKTDDVTLTNDMTSSTTQAQDSRAIAKLTASPIFKDTQQNTEISPPEHNMPIPVLVTPSNPKAPLLHNISTFLPRTKIEDQTSPKNKSSQEDFLSTKTESDVGDLKQNHFVPRAVSRKDPSFDKQDHIKQASSDRTLLPSPLLFLKDGRRHNIAEDLLSKLLRSNNDDRRKILASWSDKREVSKKKCEQSQLAISRMRERRGGKRNARLQSMKRALQADRNTLLQQSKVCIFIQSLIDGVWKDLPQVSSQNKQLEETDQIPSQMPTETAPTTSGATPPTTPTSQRLSVFQRLGKRSAEKPAVNQPPVDLDLTPFSEYEVSPMKDPSSALSVTFMLKSIRAKSSTIKPRLDDYLITEASPENRKAQSSDEKLSAPLISAYLNDAQTSKSAEKPLQFAATSTNFESNSPKTTVTLSPQSKSPITSKLPAQIPPSKPSKPTTDGILSESKEQNKPPYAKPSVAKTTAAPSNAKNSPNAALTILSESTKRNVVPPLVAKATNAPSNAEISYPVAKATDVPSNADTSIHQGDVSLTLNTTRPGKALKSVPDSCEKLEEKLALVSKLLVSDKLEVSRLRAESETREKDIADMKTKAAKLKRKLLELETNIEKETFAAETAAKKLKKVQEKRTQRTRLRQRFVNQLNRARKFGQQMSAEKSDAAKLHETFSVPAPKNTEKMPADLSEAQRPSLKRKLDSTEDITLVKIPHKDNISSAKNDKLSSDIQIALTTKTLNSEKSPNQITQKMDILKSGQHTGAQTSQPAQENLTINPLPKNSITTKNLQDRSVSLEENVVQTKLNKGLTSPVKPIDKPLDPELQPSVVKSDAKSSKRDINSVKAVLSSGKTSVEISSPKVSQTSSGESASAIDKLNATIDASLNAQLKRDNPKAKQATKTVATHAKKQALKSTDKKAKSQTANRLLKERLEEKAKLLQRAQALTRENRIKKLGILKETRSANRRENSSPIRSTSNMSRAKTTSLTSSSRAQTKANLNLKLDEALANMKQLSTKKVAPLVVPNEFINESAPDTSLLKSGNPRRGRDEQKVVAKKREDPQPSTSSTVNSKTLSTNDAQLINKTKAKKAEVVSSDDRLVEVRIAARAKQLLESLFSANSVSPYIKQDDCGSPITKMFAVPECFKKWKFTHAEIAQLATVQSGQKTIKAKQQDLRPYVSHLRHFRSYRLHSFFRTQENLSITSPTFSNKIDPERILCKFGLNGKCMASTCNGQHLNEILLKPEELYLDLLSYCPKLVASNDGKVVSDKDTMEVRLQATETAVQRLCGATAMTADEKSILLVSHINKNIPHKPLSSISLVRNNPPLRFYKSNVEQSAEADEDSSANTVFSWFNQTTLDEIIPEPAERFRFSDPDEFEREVHHLTSALQREPDHVESRIRLAYVYSLNLEQLNGEARIQRFNLALNALCLGIERNESSEQLWCAYLPLLRHHHHGDLGDSDLEESVIEQVISILPYSRRCWSEIMKWKWSYAKLDGLYQQIIQNLIYRDQIVAEKNDDGESSLSLDHEFDYYSSWLLSSVIERSHLACQCIGRDGAVGKFQETLQQLLSLKSAAIDSPGQNSTWSQGLQLPVNQRDSCTLYLCFIHLSEFGSLPDALFDDSLSKLDHGLCVSDGGDIVLPFASPYHNTTERLHALFKEALLICDDQSQSPAQNVIACLPLYRSLVELEASLKRWEAVSITCSQLIKVLTSDDTVDRCHVTELWMTCINCLLRSNNQDIITKTLQSAVTECPGSVKLVYTAAMYLSTRNNTTDALLHMDTCIRKFVQVEDQEPATIPALCRLYKQLLKHESALLIGGALKITCDVTTDGFQDNKPYLWLIYCLLTQLTFEGSSRILGLPRVSSVFEAAVHNVTSQHALKDIWIHFLLYYRSTAADLDRHHADGCVSEQRTKWFRNLVQLARRCLLSFPAKRAVESGAGDTSKCYFNDYTLHNTVCEIFTSCFPARQKQVALSMLAELMPTNVPLLLRAAGPLLRHHDNASVISTLWRVTSPSRGNSGCYDVRIWKMSVAANLAVKKYKKAIRICQRAINVLPYCTTLWKDVSALLEAYGSQSEVRRAELECRKLLGFPLRSFLVEDVDNQQEI